MIGSGRPRAVGGPLLAAVLALAALFVLRRELRAHTYHEIASLVAALPAARLASAAALTALGYVVLGGYDLLALRYVGRHLPTRRTLLASFVAYAFSQSVGVTALTGASIRYRFWSAWGLGASEIAQGVAFTTVTFWLGVLLIGGAALVAAPAAVPVPALSPVGARALGGTLLLLVAAYLAWCAARRTPVTVRGWAFAPPGPQLAVLQLAVSTVDWLLAGAVLYALLPPAAGLALLPVLGVFVVAQVAGLVSHVPGGMGVFESVVVVLLRGRAPVPLLVASLVAFRVVYYLLPLAAGVATLAAYELLQRRERVAGALRRAERWVPVAAPYLLSGAAFAAGLVLLFSGATPGVRWRLHRLDALLPLGVIELAHFAASVAGMVLVLVAFGLRRRLDAAWHLAVGALAAGAVASVLKGLDWEEALVLAVVLGATLPARAHFYRRAALTSEPLTPGWIAAVALALGSTLWLGFFSYEHVAYSHDLWWRFALRGDAPRFLRAMVGASVTALVFAVTRLVRHARPRPQPPTAAELARIRAIVHASPATEANLALLGDKALVLGENGESFLMYAVAGRSWVALGDPVGPPDAQRELAWRFRELAAEHGGRPVFYQVSQAHLPLYIDLGLSLLKLGEEARVPLPGFCLDAPERRRLRAAVRQAERAGCSFEIVPPEAAGALMPELRRVSDAWLAQKRTREKGFSLGRFDEAYLANFPIALVRCAGHVTAFANVWPSAGREELSLDLMRYLPDAHPATMDYLFSRLMAWGAAQGYRWFNLGMAPLSGFDRRALAPLWTRIGALIFAHGEHFYNFQGLRRYKEKFRPVWEPRYLAAPGGLALPAVLTNVAALVSGGLAGVVRK